MEIVKQGPARTLRLATAMRIGCSATQGICAQTAPDMMDINTTLSSIREAFLSTSARFLAAEWVLPEPTSAAVIHAVRALGQPMPDTAQRVCA